MKLISAGREAEDKLKAGIRQAEDLRNVQGENARWASAPAPPHNQPITSNRHQTPVTRHPPPHTPTPKYTLHAGLLSHHLSHSCTLRIILRRLCLMPAVLLSGPSRLFPSISLPDAAWRPSTSLTALVLKMRTMNDWKRTGLRSFYGKKVHQARSEANHVNKVGYHHLLIGCVATCSTHWVLPYCSLQPTSLAL